MKTFGGVNVYRATSRITSALDGGEWSASRPSCFTHRRRSSRHPLYRRLGRPQRKISCPCWESNPSRKYMILLFVHDVKRIVGSFSYRCYVFVWLSCSQDRLCGLVVRVPGYRSWGPGFDSRRYQIFWVVGLERGPLSLVRIIEELLEWKSIGSGQESRINSRGILCADHTTPSIRKSWH
jgi:hypothetical protein